jgi:predicted DNA binding CopG/RHH family protein
MIGLRLSEDDIERVDRWAKERGLSRSDAIRALIEQGLKK